MAKTSIVLLLWLGPAIGIFCYGLWFVLRARLSRRLGSRQSGSRGR